MQLLFVFNTLTLHKKICQWSGVRHSIKLCQLSNGISNMLMVYGHLVKFTYCFRLQPPWFRLERVCVLSHFSRVRLFATLWTVAHHAPLSMGFSRQECWSGLPCLPLGDLPDPGSNPGLLRYRTLYYLSHQRSNIYIWNAFNWLYHCQYQQNEMKITFSILFSFTPMLHASVLINSKSIYIDSPKR